VHFDQGIWYPLLAARGECLYLVQGQSAISSADYFGDSSQSGRSGSQQGLDAADLVNRLSYTAKQDLQNLKSIASTASKKFANLAQTFVRDLQQGGY
jgi:ADP-ribosylation factor GTPase-activating protein 2/3